MKASLIVPVYNVAPYVEQCIQSIKNQSFKDFECIIVDDDSTDDSYSLCLKETKDDPRFHVFHQRHMELSAARNYGLSFASGEYIWWIDSDDYLKPDYILHSLNFMEANQLDMAFFDAEVIDNNSSKEIAKNERNYFYRQIDHGICSGPQMFSSMLKSYDLVYAVFLQCIRRDKIRKLFLDRLMAQDMLYTIQNLLLQERVGYLPEILYCKRSRDGSAISSPMTFQKAYGAYRTVMEILKWIEDERIENKIGKDAMHDLEWWLDRMKLSMTSRWERMSSKEIEKLDSLPFKDKWIYRQFLGLTRKGDPNE